MTPPVISRQSKDLGHPTRDLDRIIALVESRIRLGQLPEGPTKKYLDALGHQRELSLQRPPTLVQRVGSGMWHSIAL